MGRHGPSAGYDADEQEEPGPTTRLLSQDVPAYDPETRATMAYESFPAIEDSPPPRRWGRGVPRAFRVVALLVTVSTGRRQAGRPLPSVKLDCHKVQRLRLAPLFVVWQ